MSGTTGAILAYTIGLALIVGYAAILWRASRRIDRRDHDREQHPHD